MKIYFYVITCIASFTLMVITSFAQPGTLDASFGNGGKVITQVGDSSSVANAVVVTVQGKILVGGTSYIAGRSVATLLQYNSDGTLDTSFGDKGKYLLPGAYGSSISSIALQPDGKIIAGGTIISGSYNLLVARFNSNGSIDSTFGNNGIAPRFNQNGYAGSDAKKVIVKPDGKILAGGEYSTNVFTEGTFIVQYLPNGSIDSSFGDNGTTGISVYILSIVRDELRDITLTADGKILATAGEVPIPPGNSDFRIHRLLPDGRWDSTFGENGFSRMDIDDSSNDVAYSTVVLPDHSFVEAGYSDKFVYHSATDYYSTTRIALAKYHSDGSLDSSFGINGKVLTLLPDSIGFANHISLSPDGRLIVSGYDGKNNDFIVIKYLPDGSLDSSFGTNSITSTDFSGITDISYSSALQPDGKIILAGSTGNNTNYNIALVRYNNDIVYPLQLLSFTAIQSGGSNLLQWHTAQEVNTSVFEVEKSSDGKNYYSIGFVNAGSNPYSFTDNKPFNGNNYYRLKMIDRNGSFTNSPVRIIKNSFSLLANIYPNPVVNTLQVHISNNKEEIVKWQIVSADGRVLMLAQWSLQAGSFVKQVNVTALSKGSYYLMVAGKNGDWNIAMFEKM